MNIPIVNLPFPLPINAWLTTPSNQTFTCCLHIDKQITSDFSDGVNSTRTYLKGRTVGIGIPSNVNVDSRLSARLRNNDTGKDILGVFIVKKILQSQWKDVNNFYGEIIEGEFMEIISDESLFG